ncbi:uncharacterized protein B0H18DRAFT_981887 [Fomitopsis serialis]|uniref:uncharacterized protein n=1 Tax=Fomitopsis serialis TaxID=139415 RepID=UPI00200798E4|nr:uncharacterized protein B0H18DRAFT_981887 [Neoantrodia serialis]KAH9933756.1 hypothetical protein B0H18DRAFT_981887 [Neoantrodia serialis]
MRHRDLEVLIKCDGKELEEHNIQVEGNVSECYTASESDKAFNIRFTNHTATSFAVRVTVDGRPFPRGTWMDADKKDVLLDCGDGHWVRPVKFARLCVTDGDDAARELSNANSLGLIEIHVVRAIYEKRMPWTTSGLDPQNFGSIHETVKKGGMHCVSFGEKQRIEYSGDVIQCLYTDQWSAPYVHFKFRYRPHAILQAQGIVEPVAQPQAGPSGGNSSVAPNSPSPEPGAANAAPRRNAQADSYPPRKRPRRVEESSSSSSSSSAEDPLTVDGTEDVKPRARKGEDEDDAEDLDALKAQMRAIRRKINKAQIRKSQRGQSSAVKREPSPIEVGDFDGGVIDLTED